MPAVLTPATDDTARSILIVDDEERIRDNLATLLRAGAYRVETVGNGVAAVDILSQTPFDLVITDIMMEGGDGFSVLEWVRSNSPRTLVTVITGYASMESTIRAMRDGAFDYLVKPFDFELLSISVERAMRRVEADRERERALAELEAWSHQLKAINSIGRRAAATLNETELLQLVARALHGEFGYYHVYMVTVDDETRRLTIRAQAGSYEGQMPDGFSYSWGTGITGKAIADGRRVLVNDVSLSSDYYELMPQTRSQLTLPILSEGQPIGAISVESAEPNTFDIQDVTLLETLADMVASSIKTVRLFQQVKETKDYLEALIASSADAIVTTDPKGVVTFFSPGAVGIYGYEPREVVGRPVAEFYKNGAPEAAKVMSLLAQHERIKNYETVLKGKDGREVYASLSASLLKDRSGQVIGTLGLSKDITHRVELERKLKELTITDSLTGLYNQRYFQRKVRVEMERARRQSRELMLMLFDLDHFKQYNDSHGHVEGDKLLREVGRLVRDSIRNMVDSAYRYGGDEFTILFPDLSGELGLAVVDRIKRSIEDGLGDEVSLSVGLVGLRSHHTAEEFVRMADEAMYESKKGRTGRITFR